MTVYKDPDPNNGSTIFFLGIVIGMVSLGAILFVVNLLGHYIQNMCHQ